MDRFIASYSMADSPQVLVLSQRVPFPPNKGDKIRTYHQIRSMVERGFDISVCTLLGDDGDRRDLDELETSLGVRTYGADLGPRWSRMSRAFLKGQPISVSFFYAEALSRTLGSLLERERVDAIMCTSSAMAEYVFRSGVRERHGDASPLLVMDFMDVDSEKWREYARRSGFPKRWVFRRESRLIEAYERAVYRLFDASLLVSEQELEVFRSGTGVTGDKLHAVGNGVALGPRPVRAERPVDRANLLFTGVMDYFPNEDAMLWFHDAMWPRIRSRWPHSTLTIAGMRPTRKLRAIGRQPGVEVTGFVDDISRYHADADVFIAPFRIARGVQNKILQAFAAGVPVVTTPEGADGIACSDALDVAVAGEPDVFVDAVDLLLSDPDRHERQRLAARRLVESHYSWEARNRPLESIIAEGVAERRDRRHAERPGVTPGDLE